MSSCQVLRRFVFRLKKFVAFPCFEMSSGRVAGAGSSSITSSSSSSGSFQKSDADGKIISNNTLLCQQQQQHQFYSFPMDYYTPLLIIVRVEATSRNVSDAHILEIAIILTDAHLNVISECHEFPIIIPELMDKLLPTIHAMYRTNDLLKDRDKHLNHHKSLTDIDHLFMQIIQQSVTLLGHRWTGDIIPVGENTWRHMDFVKRHLPGFASSMSHRYIDLSVFHTLHRLYWFYWIPERTHVWRQERNHRATHDARSITDELYFYRCVLMYKTEMVITWLDWQQQQRMLMDTHEYYSDDRSLAPVASPSLPTATDVTHQPPITALSSETKHASTTLTGNSNM